MHDSPLVPPGRSYLRAIVPGDEPEGPPLDPELSEPPEWNTRVGRRTMREKTVAGLSGLKYALRGDSSFFAHAYRGLLIALIGALLGISPLAWCVFGLAMALVFVAELAHSAIDTLARSLGDPEEQGLKVAREIATAGVLVSVVTLAALSVAILTLRLGDLFQWW
jgi:diacylglycerol kinase (ATP)